LRELAATWVKMAIKALPEGTKSELLNYAIKEMDNRELIIENERDAAIEEMKERLFRYSSRS
jgi:hypothetical protein